MDRTHLMDIAADNGDEILLNCPVVGCGRRVVIKRSGGFLVLDRGDFFATHSGSTAGLDITGLAS
jgi:hypothetical protein